VKVPTAASVQSQKEHLEVPSELKDMYLFFPWDDKRDSRFYLHFRGIEGYFLARSWDDIDRIFGAARTQVGTKWEHAPVCCWEVFGGPMTVADAKEFNDDTLLEKSGYWHATRESLKADVMSRFLDSVQT
jgi:hypothetical protein